MPYKAVIFDLDGTLINTLEDLAGAMNFALAQLNQPTHSLDACQQMIGSGVSMFVKRALLPEKQHLAPKILDLMRRRYADHCFDKTAPYHKIEELLENLQSRGVTLAVCTNKDQHPAELTIRHFFGPDAFTAIAGANNGVAIKPDPASTLRIVKNMELKPADCLFVGDSDIDIQTAINANIHAVGVTWGFRTQQQLEQAGAKTIISSPMELLDLLA